jgi:hypothetical protein
MTTGLVIQQLLARGEPGAPRGVFAGPFAERAMRPGPDRPGPDGLLLEVLGRRLDLSAEQEERVREIVLDYGARADEVMRSLRPRMVVQLDSLRLAIAEVLTPEQREKFEALGWAGLVPRLDRAPSGAAAIVPRLRPR